MEWIAKEAFEPDPLSEPLLSEVTALVVVDLQYLDAHPDFGIGAKLKETGEFAEARYYFEQVGLMIPKVQRLQQAARDAGTTVIHTRLCSRTPDGRDRTRLHKMRNWTYSAGSKEADFLPEVAPLEGEIVLDKTTSGAFASTSIDQLLRNMGIRNVIATGVDTCYCIETTVRDAADRGYRVILAGDACATKTPEMQESALRRLRAGYCEVRRVEEIVTALRLR